MDLSNLPVIDWDLALKLAGQKPDLAKELLALLLKGLPQDFDNINEAYQRKNYIEMLRLVHKLHGALCYCGTPRLKTLIARLEFELKNNIIENLPTLVELLNIEVKRVLENPHPHTA